MCAPIAVPTGAACAGIVEITLKTAIDAHMRWKDGLENHVHGFGKEALNFAEVAADDKCLLGKWIHGPGKAVLGKSGIFRELVAAHARFHRQAAAIVAALQRGDHAEATERLQVGEYPRTSAEVKLLLARLYVEALSATGRPRRDDDDY